MRFIWCLPGTGYMYVFNMITQKILNSESLETIGNFTN